MTERELHVAFFGVKNDGLPRSTRTGALLCGCGEGYASEAKQGPHYGLCNLCYRAGLPRKELNKLGLTRP